MATDPNLARYEFKRKLEQMQGLKGRATELISLYIPPTKQISDVTAYLRNEFSQSSNIKSKSTRKNVTSAIESIMSKLKYFRKPPEKGVVFFTGHVAASGDQTTMVSHVIEPPDTITTFLYRCDSEFYLEPLLDMLKERETYGLIVVDRAEATIGLIRGRRIGIIKNIQSLVPSKHGKGGQSQHRFERLIEIAAHEFFTKVAEVANEAFLSEKELKGILIGGPGATKNFFLDKGYLHHELLKKVIDTFDTGYTDEYGLRELVDKSKETLSGIALMKEKDIIQRFLSEVRKPDAGLSIYGEGHIRRALTMGAIETLLVSEALKKFKVSLRCGSCQEAVERVTESPEPLQDCPKCGEHMDTESSEDLVSELFGMAEDVGSSVVLVSRDSEEGEMLLRAFGGLAGILRYKLEM